MTATPDGTAALLALVTELRDEVKGLRDDLARREDRRMREAGTHPAGRTAARSSAPASTGGGAAVFPNYGRAKGQPIYGASLQELQYYANGARKSLADPSKSRWHDKERALLRAIEEEMERQGYPTKDEWADARGGQSGGGTSFGGGFADRPPPDDDVPF